MARKALKIHSVIGNDQILCGNVLSTFYLVTPMKDATRPLGAGIPYVVCNGSVLHTCGNGTTPGSFNFNTADPMTTPPPTPGLSVQEALIRRYVPEPVIVIVWGLVRSESAMLMTAVLVPVVVGVKVTLM